MPPVFAGTLRLSALPLLLLLTGCSHGASNFTFASPNGGPTHVQHFNSAYIGLSAAGAYDIVIFNDYLRPPAGPASTAPLDPIRTPALQEVLRVHLFWRGTHGANAGEKLLSNATLDLTIFGKDPAHAGDLLRYEGSGYVSVSADPGHKKSGIVRVTIRDGEMHRTTLRGDLHDIMGPIVLSGSIDAVHDDERVQAVIEAVNDQIANKPPKPGEVRYP